MAFFSDTMTDSSGAALTAHTPDVGTSWTQHSASALAAVISNANRARNAGSGSGLSLNYATPAPAGADYSVTADLYVRADTANKEAGVAGRIDTAATTYYAAKYVQAEGLWRLEKVVAGSATSLGTYSQALSALTTYVVKLEMIGTAIKLFVDGVERVSVTDSAITAAGRAGLLFLNNTTNTTGYHLDNYDASDIGAAPARAPRLALLGVGP